MLVSLDTAHSGSMFFDKHSSHLTCNFKSFNFREVGKFLELWVLAFVLFPRFGFPHQRLLLIQQFSFLSSIHDTFLLILSLSLPFFAIYNFSSLHIVSTAVLLQFSLKSCLTFCDPMDFSPPGSSGHGNLQARILEWLAIPFSRESSWPRDWTQVSHIVGRFFYCLNHQGSPPSSLVFCYFFLLYFWVFPILIYFIHVFVFLMFFLACFEIPGFILLFSHAFSLSVDTLFYSSFFFSQ